jgi:GNAT superfamily N-acetyltransferase
VPRVSCAHHREADVTRRLSLLTLDVLDDLPDPCRSCVFWELDPVAGERARRSGDPALDKEAWVSSTLLSWGSCGTLVHVDDAPAGYALYAPPGSVPRATAFPTAPVSADAVLLATLRVVPGFEGGGIGRMLVQGMVRDLSRRGVRAVEAYGDAQPSPDAPSCVVPADFLLAVGFKTVRPHRRWPRLRLDVKGAQSWRAEAEARLERLLGARLPVRSPEPAFRR